MIDIIDRLESLSPRRGVRVERAARIIEDLLSNIDIKYDINKTPLTIPNPRIVKVEGVPEGIEMEPNCFEGGVVDGSVIISSFAVNSDFPLPNINYSPYSEAVSLSTFFRKPAVAL